MKRLATLSAVLTLLAAHEALALEYIVTNRNDSGSGSLRQAITAANNNPGPDTIIFGLFADAGINGTVTTFTPLSPLPSITDTVHIDGTTAWGFNTTTRVPAVVINGVNAGAGAKGLIIGASNCTIEALSIVNFTGAGNTGAGIHIANGNFSRIQGCWLGTLPTWDPAPNTVGIYLTSSFNLVGGGTPAARNVISNNQTYGIYATTASGGSNDIQGNYIGMTPDGFFRHPNLIGIYVSEADGTIIGSAGDGFRNVITGNNFAGVYLTRGANSTVITNNYIGLALVGGDFGNATGIHIGECENTIIGAPGAPNFIGANTGAGIRLTTVEPALPVTRGTRIQSNYIGTTVAGNGDRANGQGGIVITHAEQTLIGGTTEAERNVIIGNTGAQIRLESASVNGATVSGNYISSGINPAGGYGVVLSGCQNVLIGTDAPTILGWNTIVSNKGSGIFFGKSGGFNTEAPGQITINCRIQGNVIGTVDAGNNNGIEMTAGNSNTIAGNYIASNLLHGILLSTGECNFNRITGNSIGVALTIAPGQQGNEFGLTIQGGSNNAIGGNGTTEYPGTANVIANNRIQGIAIEPQYQSGGGVVSEPRFNRVINNFIGVKLGEEPAQRTQIVGIYMVGGEGNVVGGTGTAEGNVISGNFYGMRVQQVNSLVSIEGNRFGTASGELLSNWAALTTAAPTNVRFRFNDVRYCSGEAITTVFTPAKLEISRNTWQNNASLPVDLNRDGLDPNDGAPDNGAQNHPEILSVRAGALGYEVAGRIVSSPLSFMRIEMYSGTGNQPEQYHGATTVFTDADGYAVFNVRIPGDTDTGRILTATATEPGDDVTAGTTSEFSPPVSLGGLLANKWGIMAIRRQGNDILLDIPTIQGRPYTVKTSTTTSGGWTTLETFNASGPLRTVRHSGAIAPGFPRRFYRVEEENF